MYQFLIHNKKIVLMMNSSVFLVLKCTLSRRLGIGVIDLLNIVSSLADLFSSCQLHNSYTKYIKLFLSAFDQGKSLSPFPC